MHRMLPPEGAQTWYDSLNLCPRCAEWQAQRDMFWNMAFAAVLFAAAPAAVVVINALR